MGSIVKKLKHKLRSSRKKKEEKLFLDNGGIFLEKLIADCNGKSIPIRNFSSSHILKATNNFDDNFIVNVSWSALWYKGIIEDKPYLIKNFTTFTDDKNVFNDIVLSARMSNHNNFLKLIGCCFDFSPAVVVFEYEELASLFNNGRIVNYILPWSVRLKIAKELAIAITYLHTAFPRIIIHKDINPSNIFLDKNGKSKLIDFRFSVSLPQGKSKIQEERVTGTNTYMDPLYVTTGFLSEYTDVYSFGVCLLGFLIEKSPFAFFDESHPFEVPQGMISYVKDLHENEKLDEIINPMIVKDITNGQRLQAEAWMMLALRCCEAREEDRPKMIQVAKELKRIEKMEQSLDAPSAIWFPKHEMQEDEPYVFKSTRKVRLN